MAEMSLNEALLFRTLSGLFGSERVIWSMSVLTVCGGELPTVSSLPALSGDLHGWAGSTKCLFTIVDHNDEPKMVVQFAEDYSQAIDVLQLEHEQLARPLLSACGVRYVKMKMKELEEILDPNSSLDLIGFLQEKVFERDNISSES